jgi:hypothetical protein
MSERFHVGTFLWGLFLAVAGAGLFGVAVQWWDIDIVDWRYVAPVVVMLIGATVLIGGITRPNRDR